MQQERDFSHVLLKQFPTGGFFSTASSRLRRRLKCFELTIGMESKETNPNFLVGSLKIAT